MGGCFVLKTGAATVDALTHVLVEPCRAAFAHCVRAGDYRALPGGVPCHQSRGGRWTRRDIGMRPQHSGWPRGSGREREERAGEWGVGKVGEAMNSMIRR